MFAVRGRPRFTSLAVFALVLFGRAAPRSRPSHRAVRLACFRKNGSQAHTHGNAFSLAENIGKLFSTQKKKTNTRRTHTHAQYTVCRP
uniref:Putative secreted protein n=1 Tax=Anopheles darlingi TaxID=43151 RepID=A0A2M4DJ12_ANODA